MVILFQDPNLLTQDLTILSLLAVALAATFVIELRTTRIPNALVLTLLIASVGIAAWDGRWYGRLLAFAFVSVAAIGGFLIGWWPGGVGKLAIAIGTLGGVIPALAALGATVGICFLLMSLYRNDEEIPEHRRFIPGSPALAAGMLIGIGVQKLVMG